MSAKISLFGVSAILTLGACQPTGPIVGGPCSYDTVEVDGTVSAVSEERVIVGTEGDEIAVPAEYVRSQLAVGDAVTVKIETITEGTCTPVIYTVETRAG